MRKVPISVWLVGFAALFLIGTTWNAGYESSPAGSDLASDLDTFIQGFKAEVRQRAEVEHSWGSSTDDNGLHAMGSARCFVQNSAPTAINGGTAALGQYNSAASADGGTALTTDEVGAATRDIGAGRCWVDLDGLDGVAGTIDDRQLNVWDETANAFVPVTARDIAGPGLAFNQVYNGSFEVTDGTGSTASTTAPAGWSNLDTATIAYVDPTAVTEGEGVALRTTAAGGALEGVRQTLANLKASTAYVFRARVRATSGDTCTMGVTDGTTTVSDVSTTTGAFETLEVSLTTTAVPANVTLDLTSTADTDVCDWDHVTVFERLPVVAQPGVQVCHDTDSSTTADAYTTINTWVDALVSCAVTVPGPGFVVEVHGQLVADHEVGGTTSLAARLRENGTTTRAVGVAAATADSDASGDFRDIAVVPVYYIVANPTPGDTLTFTLEAMPSQDGSGVSWDRNFGTDGANDFDSETGLVTTLDVKMYPAR